MVDTLKTQLEMLAAYNHWANRRLYAAAAQLTDEEYRSDRGAFFGSLHGTLNHILLADRIWMHRFTGEGEEPTALDAILFDIFDDLRIARETEDRLISAFVATQTERDLDMPVSYRTTRAPALVRQPLTPLLIHFFNHQTHHRGQAHSILTSIKSEAPSLDLLIFQRDTGIGLLEGQGGDFSQPERRSAPRPVYARVPVASSLGETIGYSRAVRTGSLIFVSGTTAISPDGSALYPGDAGKQADVIMERIGAALKQLRGSLADVVETRIYLTDIANWRHVEHAHGRVFADAKPATTIVQVGPLVAPDLLVEISALAVCRTA